MALTPGRDYFTGLALELHREIVSYLPLFHKLKLRTVFNKQHEDVVVDILGDAVKTLYVQPTIESLQRFERLCASPFFQKSVVEIVFLPWSLKAPGPDTLSFSEYRNKHEGMDVLECRSSFAFYRSITDEHVVDHQRGEVNEATIASLERGIRGLALLEAVSVLSAAEQDGLNALIANYAPAFLNQRILQGNYNFASPSAREAAFEEIDDNLYYDEEQIGALFTALQRSCTNVKRLAVGQYEVPFACPLLDSNTVKFVLSRVEALTVSCINSWLPQEGTIQKQWKFVAENASEVEHLTIMADSGSGDPEKGVAVIDRFLDFGDYHRLRRLDVKAARGEYCVVNAKKLETFLFGHRHTVREVRLQNIILFTPPKNRAVDGTVEAVEQVALPDHWIRELSTRIRYWIPGLQTFQMKIPQLAYYDLFGDYWISGPRLGELADELGVELKDRVWDFGRAAVTSDA